MDFIDMILKLQTHYPHYILLVSCGAFYVTAGVDAVTLSEELGLNVICGKRNICKIGIPQTAILKHLKKLEELEYSYLVLYYSSEKNTLLRHYEYISQKEKDKIMMLCKDCNKCKHKSLFKKSKYEKALIDYEEREEEFDVEW